MTFKNTVPYFAFILCLLVLPLAVSGNEREVVYFDFLSDVPVMPQLEPAPDESYVFDKPQGRIISEIAYADNVSKEDIYDFYFKALPALGWAAKSTSVYVRENEKLNIVIESEKQLHQIKFFLSPVE